MTNSHVWVISAGDNYHGYHVVAVTDGLNAPRERMARAMLDQFRFHGGAKPEDLWEWKFVSADCIWLYSSSIVYAYRKPVESSL